MGDVIIPYHTFRGKNIKRILKSATEIDVPKDEMLTTTMYRLHMEYKKGNNVKAKVPNTKDGYLYSCDAQTLDDICKQYAYGPFADIAKIPSTDRYETVCCFLAVYLANKSDFDRFCKDKDIYDAFVIESRKYKRFIELFGEKFCKQDRRHDWDILATKNRPVARNVLDIMELLYFNEPLENLRNQFIIRNDNTVTALEELKQIQYFAPRGNEFVEEIEKYAKDILEKITEIKNQK